MSEIKNTPTGANDPTDIRYYLHQPHDKYMRALLQHRETALAIIQYVLEERIRNLIDLDSLQLSNTTFLNENLQISLADICYEGFTKDKEPFRICLLFEHKSELAERIYEQLSRYINNVWLEDQKQNRPPTLSIPILIYHGTTPITKESPARLFPDAPPELLRFVPHFDYVVLDTAALSEADIDGLGQTFLRQILLALKFSRNEAYLQKNWKKVLIFAKQYHHDTNFQIIIKYTLLYMVSVSKTVQETLENPATNLAEEEQELVLPYVFEKYRLLYKEEGLREGMEKGMEKGIEKGIEKGMEKGRIEGMILLIQKFIKNNPGMKDKEVANFFEVPLSLVKTAQNG